MANFNIPPYIYKNAVILFDGKERVILNDSYADEDGFTQYFLEIEGEDELIPYNDERIKPFTGELPKEMLFNQDVLYKQQRAQILAHCFAKTVGDDAPRLFLKIRVILDEEDSRWTHYTFMEYRSSDYNLLDIMREKRTQKIASFNEKAVNKDETINIKRRPKGQLSNGR